MSDTTHQSYEQKVATPEGSALARRIAMTKEAVPQALYQAERLDPTLMDQPAQPAYSPDVQAAVTDLAAYRQRSAIDDARAAVAALQQEQGYGRAA